MNAPHMPPPAVAPLPDAIVDIVIAAHVNAINMAGHYAESVATAHPALVPYDRRDMLKQLEQAAHIRTALANAGHAAEAKHLAVAAAAAEARAAQLSWPQPIGEAV